MTDSLSEGDVAESETTGSRASNARHKNAFTVPAFRYLWLNNLAFVMASNAQRFVFAWYVLDGLDRSESEQGLVVFMLGVPSVLLTLHAGVWADRWNRKRLLVGSQLASAAAMALAMILVARGDAGMTWVIILALASGAASAVGQPVRQALVPSLVSREQLMGAIALNAIAITLSMVLGAVIARVFGRFWDFEGAFGFMLLLFVLGQVALIFLKLPTHTPAAEARRSLRKEMFDAVRFIRETRPIRMLLGLLALAAFTMNPLVMVIMQAHVKEELGRNSGDAAFPLALMGFGMAISSMFVMRQGSMERKGALFMRAMIVGGTCTSLMGRTTALWQLMALCLVMGLAGGFYINMNQGLIQSHTPQEVMGRVMGVLKGKYTGQMDFGAVGALIKARLG